MTAETAPPALPVDFLAGTNVFPPIDTIDAVFVMAALNVVAKNEPVPGKRRRYLRVLEALRTALDTYDHFRGLPSPDTLCQLCHEREATQRIEYTFTLDIVPCCDECSERGEEAEDG